jgi:hypothetical protein
LRKYAGKIPHDAHGLFDILGVKEIARRRDCEMTWVSDMFLKVSGMVWRKMPVKQYEIRTLNGVVKKATITATGTGKWAAPDILRACTRPADGRPSASRRRPSL